MEKKWLLYKPNKIVCYINAIEKVISRQVMRINRLRPHNIFQDAQSGKGGVKKELQKIRVLILTSVIMSAIFFCMSWFAASGRLNWNLKILFKWKIRLKHWESCSLHICDIRTGVDFNESEFLPHLRGSYFSLGFSKCSLCEAKMIHRGNSSVRCATT